MTNIRTKAIIAGITAFLAISMPVLGAPSYTPPIEGVGQSASVRANSLISVSSPGNPNAMDRTLDVVVTAYSSTPGQTDDTPFITANGTYVRFGIVAANFLPFGTKIKIPSVYGDRIFTVEDRMNQRKSYHVDVWLPDYFSAKDFGARYTDIQILGS